MSCMELILLDLTERKFGIEIECMGTTREQVVDALANIGMKCAIQDYNHEDYDFWKIVPDSSVYSGFEVVSPPLIGKSGFDDVKKVFDVLTTLGAQVDRRCGFHVHVDANDLSAKDMLCVAKRYEKYEHKIDAVMPPSRREDNNGYCLSMKRFFTEYDYELKHCRLNKDFSRRIDDRYFKVNLCSFERHGTVEFRQHGGTVEYNKAINWIQFCIHMMEHTKKHNRTEDIDTRNIPLTPVAAERFNKVIDMLTVGSRITDVALACKIQEDTVRDFINRRIRVMGYNVDTNRQTNEVKISIPDGGTVGKILVLTKRNDLPGIEDFPVVTMDPFAELDQNITEFFSNRAKAFGMKF